jgi:hypothetical protein
MSSVLEILASSLGQGAVNQISQKLDLNSSTTRMIVMAALPLLISALARNSSTTSGANSLQNALTKDHDGSILDDIMGFLGNSDQATSDGASILKHVLGDQKSSVQQNLGKSTGVDARQAGQILEMLAPIVMGALAKKSANEGLDAGGLSDLLKGEVKQAHQAEPDLMGSLAGMLDSNKDGSVIDDIGGFLGKFLKSR